MQPHSAGMRDFKYMNLITDNPSWNGMMKAFDEIKSDCLKPCALAFKANTLRTAHFGMFPAELLFIACKNARGIANAIFRMTGRGDMTLTER